jgi:ABC-type sugar transport system substrate-binding protein
MKKRLGILVISLLIVALILSVTACSGTGEQTEQPAPEKPADTPQQPEEPADEEPAEQSNLEASLSIDISNVRGSDGQLLLEYGETREIPPKPTDKEELEMWNIEYAGRLTEKLPMIPSPKDGIIGKRIVMIQQSEHPYFTAVSNGAKMAAEAYKAELQIWNPNGDLNQQNQFVDKAIAEKVDMVLLAPLDAKAGVQQFKKLYDAGIPAIAFNMIPTDEAMKYVLAITAPDDFGQFRKLADFLAKDVGGKAGVGYITHIPGGSPYFARTTNVIKFYEQNYPDMKTLDVQSPGFDAPKSKQVVADWITRFGDELTCIVISDDSAQALGATQAAEEAGRSDIKMIAAGNSKVGMDLVAQGKLFAITYQSAEADGAIPIKVAADYFNGVELGENAAFYLPQAIITKDNVEDYMPAQW